MKNSNENLKDSKRKELQAFRERLNDILNEDFTDAILIKWLKARNFDVNAAEKIFRENYNNRILFGVNTILKTYEKPEVAEKYETTGILGFAKDGSFVRYMAAGRLDFYGFIMSMSSSDLCLYFSYLMESDIKQLKEENSRTGREVNEITYIIDLEGFHIQQVLHRCVVEMGLDFTRLLQDFYPEIWSYILIVNTADVFEKAFSLFKPVLRANVLERIKVANRDSTKELLLKYIDEDIIPAFLGGTRVDSKGDTECKEFIKFGGKVPECLYSRNRMTMLQPTDPGVRAVSIRPRSVLNISAVTTKGGRWALIETVSYSGSLTTSVFYRPLTDEDGENPKFPDEHEYLDYEDSGYKMVSVAIRSQMHCTPLDYKMFLPKPGIYVFTLNNMASWFKPNKCLVRIKVVKSLTPEISD